MDESASDLMDVTEAIARLMEYIPDDARASLVPPLISARSEVARVAAGLKGADSPAASPCLPASTVFQRNLECSTPSTASGSGSGGRSGDRSRSPLSGCRCDPAQRRAFVRECENFRLQMATEDTQPLPPCGPTEFCLRCTQDLADLPGARPEDFEVNGPLTPGIHFGRGSIAHYILKGRPEGGELID